MQDKDSGPDFEVGVRHQLKTATDEIHKINLIRHRIYRMASSGPGSLSRDPRLLEFMITACVAPVLGVYRDIYCRYTQKLMIRK